MHLETHALEDHLGARRKGHLLQDCGHLRGVQARRRHKNIELRRQQPQRCDIELASLEQKVRLWRLALGGLTYQLHDGPDSPLDIDSVVADNRD